MASAGNQDDGEPFIVYDIPSPVPPSETETRTVDGIIVVDRAFDITLTRRMRNNWSVMTNFLYNWDRDLGFVQNPNQERFNDNTVEVWAFKVVGTYRAPWGMVVSPSLRHQGGDPLARQIALTSGTNLATGVNQNINLTFNYDADRTGDWREDNITIFDARVEKRFRLKNRLASHELSLFFDAFNIANSNASQSMDQIIGRRTTTLPSGERVEYQRFVRPTGVLSPRIYRLGFKYLVLAQDTGGRSPRLLPPAFPPARPSPPTPFMKYSCDDQSRGRHRRDRHRRRAGGCRRGDVRSRARAAVDAADPVG